MLGMNDSLVLDELDGVAVGVADQEPAREAEGGIGQVDRPATRPGGSGLARTAAAAASASGTSRVVCQCTRSLGRSSGG